MSDNDKFYNILSEINTKIADVDKTLAVQSSTMKGMQVDIQDIKIQQKEHDKVVAKHEQRSTNNELKMNTLQEAHNIFRNEHESFKSRIEIAEQPGLIIKNIWKALITLGSGAAAMYVILNLLEKLK
jgi:hypothetical protein